MKNNEINFVFFGTPDFSVEILKILKTHGLVPRLVVTTPDRKRGRGQKMKETPVAKWAREHEIETLKPEKIDDTFIAKLENAAPKNGWNVFVVVAYGKILPAELIYLPKQNTLNVHPSLLPKVRGAAPIRGAILHEDETGVTIIELDEKMDHGPIVVQEKVAVDKWPPRYDKLKPVLANAGGELLARTLPRWISDDIKATPQEHQKATYIEKFSSKDGEINFDDDPEWNLRKIRAFTNWPKAHYFDDSQRIIIKDAHVKNNQLITNVI